MPRGSARGLPPGPSDHPGEEGGRESPRRYVGGAVAPREPANERMIVDRLRVVLLFIRWQEIGNTPPKNAAAHFQERGAEFVDRAHDETNEQVNENDADRDVENAGVEHSQTTRACSGASAPF